MTTTLVMLTSTFPWGRGEEFIESELEIVASRFDRVVLVATQVALEAELTRATGGNVSIHAVRTPQQSAVDRVRFLAKGLPRLLASPSSLRRAAEGLPSPTRMVASLFFEARSRYVADAIRPVMASIEASPGDRVVVYSYWFHVTARVGEILTDELRRSLPGVDVRYVTRAHGYDLYHEASGPGFLPQRRSLLNALDAVYPVSKAGADYLTSRYPEAAAKVTVQYLGSREPIPEPAVGRQKCYVTSCAFVVPVKRLDRYPAIIEAIAERGIPVVWTHVGGGPGLNALRRLVDETVSNAEVSLVGNVDNARLFEHYANAPSTVFLNLSSSEGLPVSMMEAISGGIPVVATRVGGVGEIVQEGVSGTLLSAEPTDDEVIDAILAIWNMDEERYRSLCRSARDLWEDTFRAAQNYEAFADLLLS